MQHESMKQWSQSPNPKLVVGVVALGCCCLVCRAAAQNRLKTHTVTTPLCSYHAVPCFKLQDLTMTMIKPSLNTIIASALLIPNSPLVPINLSKVKDWELMGHKNVVSTCKRASHDAYLWHREAAASFHCPPNQDLKVPRKQVCDAILDEAKD